MKNIDELKVHFFLRRVYAFKSCTQLNGMNVYVFKEFGMQWVENFYLKRVLTFKTNFLDKLWKKNVDRCS